MEIKFVVSVYFPLLRELNPRVNFGEFNLFTESFNI